MTIEANDGGDDNMRMTLLVTLTVVVLSRCCDNEGRDTGVNDVD